MPVMSALERAFCRSAPWGVIARQVVLRWALDGYELTGDVLEIGSGSGAMAQGVAATFPTVRLTVTDIDEAMVASARRRLVGRLGVTVEQADVTDLAFPSDSFDTVTSYLMLHQSSRGERRCARPCVCCVRGACSSATTSPTLGRPA